MINLRYVALALAWHVRRNALPLLRGRYGDETGRALLRAAAQLVLDAGWAAYDANAQPIARKWMLAALRMADSAGDRLFGARVLAALAHQSLYVGRRREALDLANAALVGTAQISSPRVVAMLEAMVACAAAAVSERALCESALSRAERALEKAAGEYDIPGWLDFDHGALVGHAARAYRDLRYSDRARSFAERAIDMCRTGHLRTQVQRKAILASSLADAGDLEQASSVAEELLGQARAGRLRSGLVLSDIDRLARIVPDTVSDGEFHWQARQLLEAHQQLVAPVYDESQG